MRLKRKIDDYLIGWKNNKNKMPLIVKGARQIGKTDAIKNFGKNNYKSFIEINFVLQPEYKDIFDKGFDIDRVIKDITLKNGNFEFIPNETLIFFDEIQDCPSCATSLKAFREDGRFDVICSGSLMGINYEKIESNSVGNKVDYNMYSLDFEEFLWAKGITNVQIEDLYQEINNIWGEFKHSKLGRVKRAFNIRTRRKHGFDFEEPNGDRISLIRLAKKDFKDSNLLKITFNASNSSQEVFAVIDNASAAAYTDNTDSYFSIHNFFLFL